MDSFVKIQSVQGGEFTNSQNLVDFRIPPSGVYDLGASYINLNTNIDVVDSGTQGGEGIYDVGVEWITADTQKPHFQNASVVKNVSMDCSSKGRIENIRRVDRLRQNLATYVDSQKEQLNESYININQLQQPINSQRYTQYATFNKVGAIKSSYAVQTPISIKLSDLMEFCRTSEYDTNKAGETRIHLELNRDKLEAVNRMPNSSVPVDFAKFKTISGAGNVGNTITLGTNGGADTLIVNDLSQVPYYVGQRLKVFAVKQGQAGSERGDFLVSAIEWDRATGSYSLTFNADWGIALTGAQTYSNIAIEVAEPTSATLRVQNAELVLKRVDNPQGLDEINYNTYSTEEINGNNATNYQQLFTIEPEASNVVLMFPDGSDGLISKNNDILQWRLRLNNNDLTDRDVVKESPLAYDRLALTLNSMGYSLRNLNRNAGDTKSATWGATYTEAKFNSQLIMNPLFQTDRTKLLQVNISAGGGGVSNLNLYKQLPRVFSY